MASWLYKLANVLSGGVVYDKLLSWWTFIVGLLSWGLGFIVSIVGAADYLYFSVVYRFVNVFLVVFFFFQIVEVIYYLAGKPSKVYSPRSSRGFR